MDSSEAFTIKFEDNRQVADGYVLVATLKGDENGVQLDGATIILNSEESAEITTTLANIEEPTVNVKVRLSEGQEEEVIVADRGTELKQGTGPWSVIFNKSQLEIPANTLSVGDYSATIEWTRKDAP